jgi:hypothetical protein
MASSVSKMTAVADDDPFREARIACLVADPVDIDAGREQVCASVAHDAHNQKRRLGRDGDIRTATRCGAAPSVTVAMSLIEEVRFASDSPLEGGVSCELVSEICQNSLLRKAVLVIRTRHGGAIADPEAAERPGSRRIGGMRPVWRAGVSN